MKLNFCTLFDSNYLTRGLAMYESLKEHCPEFHLYIFTFDDIATRILTKMNLKDVTIITQTEFEDMALLLVKPTRSTAEYCWTCTPSIIRYSIATYNLDNCTYVDSDLFFYNNPKVLIDEMGENSVLITEHRYTPEYNQSLTSGKYCVQFVTFINNEVGMGILNWWRNACIKWCFARFEDDKFGDQKYLDDWTTRFEGVHELKHIGGGVAPWNLQQYSFKKKMNKITLRKHQSEKYTDLVFFHYHHLKFYLNGIVKITSDYIIKSQVVYSLYFPYINLLNEIKNRIAKTDNSFDPNGAKENSSFSPYSFFDKIHLYKQAICALSRSKFIDVKKKILSHNYYFLNKIK